MPNVNASNNFFVTEIYYIVNLYFLYYFSRYQKIPSLSLVILFVLLGVCFCCYGVSIISLFFLSQHQPT